MFSLTDLTHQAYCHLDCAGAEVSETLVANCADPGTQRFEEEADRSSVTKEATLQGSEQLFASP